jgi:hypothetical protein
MIITKPPPLHYFPGIAFNSGYYTIVDEAPLTESKADSRYLIKTQTDISNNIQTFSAGIKTTFINPDGVTSLQIGAIESDLGQTTSINGPNINIGGTYTSAQTGNRSINIGTQSSLAPTVSQFVNLYVPLIVKYSPFYNLSRLGGSEYTTYALTPVLSNNTTISPVSIVGVPPGVYMVNYIVGYTNETSISSLLKQQYALTSVSASLANASIISEMNEMIVEGASLAIGTAVDYVKRHFNSGVIVLTATTTVYFTYTINWSSTGTIRIGIPMFRLTRIG